MKGLDASVCNKLIEKLDGCRACMSQPQAQKQQGTHKPKKLRTQCNKKVEENDSIEFCEVPLSELKFADAARRQPSFEI